MKLKEKIRINKKNIVEKNLKGKNGITLIALVVTIVLNCSYLAMEQMNRFEKI